MLTRDFRRVCDAYAAADVLPLGSAALAGTGYPIDRDFVAAELGFAAVSENSMDAVSDRDFLLDLTYACTVIQVHLSRLAEELVIWSSDEFGFITMADEFATGSSIMPQKKNPDFAELVRGKAGRVIGDLTALLVTLKGLPLAYNKDMQEDKEGVFDAVDTVAACLKITCGMIETMNVHPERMRASAGGGFTAATDVADHLVGTGMPFRQAHEVVGRIVLDCEREGRSLQDLTLDAYRRYAPAFGEGVLAAVDPEQVVARRSSAGGTGHGPVRDQIERQREAIAADQAWLAGAES
jgi:argininosuccinate lyase